MPNPIPASLASYISACLTPSNAHSATLLTSTLSTPSPWLTLRFVYAAIYGVEDDGSSGSLPPSGGGGPRRSAGGQPGVSSSSSSSIGGSPVILVSLLRPLALWVEIGKKLGLDIPSLIRTGRIIYVDGLPSYGGEADSRRPAGADTPAGQQSTLRLKSLTLDDMEHTMNDAMRLLSNPVSAAHPTPAQQAKINPRTPATAAAAAAAATSSARTPASSSSPTTTTTTNTPIEVTSAVVVVDGIDFMLASQQPSISVLSLQSTLATLRAKAQSLIVTCSADGPLLHNHDGVSAAAAASTTPLEADHALFVTSMAHQCQWVFQLRGLDTGTAEDVSGVVRVSRGGGGGPGDDEDVLVDAEWLYQVKGDGSVRVWGRGE